MNAPRLPEYHAAMRSPARSEPLSFDATQRCALNLDAADPLAGVRERFEIPRGRDGAPLIYFCGNSLGLMPKAVRPAVEQELHDWATLAVDAHFGAATPWYSYHEALGEPAARLVGALPHEVVMMNGLTVNLHLMMATFYRPTAQRYKILIEDSAFPSDTYAVQTQIRYHGFDPADALLIAKPRAGEHTLRTEDLEALMKREGPQIALVLFAGVNYYTGQVFDLPRIVAAGHRAGAVVGYDLAHAAGNVELRLHDWDADFAAWCTYKYLNSGPGSVAGCFVHERHARDASLPRLGGWWGNDPRTRFQMHVERDFKPVASADAWQLSNPPILSLAAVRASLAIFDEVGMPALRAKSLKLTAYLQYLLDDLLGGSREPKVTRIEVITPRDPTARGCQLSLLIHDRPRELFDALQQAGVVTDFREPDAIRVAPVPLYNTFHETWRFVETLRAAL